ncbi:MAG: hypothetical protein NTX86_04265, partial [Candidatus Dependentiae bacterium]|nr:hypothetical protein [Candidatus Dependentiae bacterium]
VEYEVVLPAIAKLSNVKNQIKQVVTSSIAEYMKPLSQYVKRTSKAVQENPYKDKIAHVRIGNELCTEEKAYLEKRMPKVKVTLEKLLGRSIDLKNVPKIALLGSGGGHRALVSFTGWAEGFTKIGLMDTVTYMAGVSGSTWFVALWLLSGLPIDKFKEKLSMTVGEGLLNITPYEFILLANSFLVKAAFDQNVTLIDIWGGLIANTFLKDSGDKRYMQYLSQQVKTIADGDWPLSIYTAIRADENSKQDIYEFTPYEIGATWLGPQGIYVPTWAYGRKFKNGVSVDFAPQQNVGFMKGTFGAAIAARIDTSLAFIFANKKILPPFDQIVDVVLSTIGNQRVTTASINNFAFGIEGSVVKDAEQINLSDTGNEINLPYAPLSGERPERLADIMIFLDVSLGLPGDFRKVEKYARKKGLKYPVINYANVENRTVSIFKDANDSTVPLVIYMPLVSDSSLIKKAKDAQLFTGLIAHIDGFDVQKCMHGGYCDTANNKYTKEQVEQLSALTEFNVLANKDTIIEAIAWKVDQLEKSHTSK